MRRILSLLAIALTVLSAVSGTVAAQSGDSTPTPTPTTTTTDDDLTKDDVLRWAREGRDISADRAKEVYGWFNSNTGAFGAEEREVVQDWVIEELTSSKTTPTDEPTTTPTTTPESSGVYSEAEEAIQDGKVTDGELGNGWDITHKRIGPLNVVAHELNGETATFIIDSERPTSATLTDVMSAETPGAGYYYTRTLASGHSVVQIPVETYDSTRQVEIAAGGRYDGFSSDNKVSVTPEPAKPYDWVLGLTLSAVLMAVGTVWMFKRRKNTVRSPGVAE